MRVLHFGKFPASHFGGIETHVKGLTEGLAAAGLDVTNLVYDLGRTTGGVVENRVNGVRIVAVPCRGTLASLPIAPSTPGTVSRMSREGSFDIAHTHFPDPLAFACLPSAGAAARIASWHSDIVRQQMFGKVYGAIARTLFDPLDAVAGATSSHLTSAQMNDFRPRQRHVVPYGVDPSRFVSTPQVAARARQLQDQANGRPIVFALGRHVYYKGFEVLIEAMRDVDACLILGGEGPLTAALSAQAAALQVRDSVRFVGRIADDELPAYYHAAAIYCLPSLATSEAFGLVQVEAMACGRPIVNCWLGNAVNEVAPDGICAVTVPPGDARAMAGALNRLLEDRELRVRLGEAGRQRVEQHFSMRAMIDATLTMYDEVLASRGNAIQSP
jgi:glycosyltransferase involved in cell wall biosynthesis